MALCEIYKAGIKGIALSLANNDISPNGLKALFTAIKSCPNLLAEIDFSNNPIGDEGSSVISQFLRESPGIRNIFLRSSKIRKKCWWSRSNRP
jgi:hypothetical protein